MTLSSPHLGSMDGAGSGLTEAGMKVYRMVKTLKALDELNFADSLNMADTFIFKLSKKPCFKYFKNVILCSSPYDNYVPYSSSRIECGSAVDIFTQKMIRNLLEQIPKSTTFIRYDCGFYLKDVNVDYLIGRAAHIEFISNTRFITQLVDDVYQYFI